MSIFNAVNATYSIRVGLSVSSGEIDHVFITLGRGQTRTFNNILDDLFGYTGGAAIDLDSGNPSLVFIVNSQVYVDTVNGPTRQRSSLRTTLGTSHHPARTT